MAKRGQKIPYRVLYVHENGVCGTIQAHSRFEAHTKARVPMLVGATVTIVQVGDDGARTVLAWYATLEDLEAAINAAL